MSDNNGHTRPIVKLTKDSAAASEPMSKLWKLLDEYTRQKLAREAAVAEATIEVAGPDGETVTAHLQAVLTQAKNAEKAVAAQYDVELDMLQAQLTQFVASMGAWVETPDLVVEYHESRPLLSKEAAHELEKSDPMFFRSMVGWSADFVKVRFNTRSQGRRAPAADTGQGTLDEWQKQAAAYYAGQEEAA